MSIDSLTLPTEELLERCWHAAGVRFTASQLSRWERVGLLPVRQHGSGKGRGRGSTPWQWNAECLERLTVIARCRQGQNISVHRAARALAEAGYLLAPKHLRGALDACLYDLFDAQTEAVRHKRRFLSNRNLTPAQKRERFHRSEVRRYGAVDPTMRAVAEQAKLVLLDLAEPATGNAISQLFSAFSQQRLRATLEAASDAELSEAFHLTNKALPSSLPLFLAASATTFMVGKALVGSESTPAKDRASLSAAMQTLERIFVPASANELAPILRLPLTLVLLHARREPQVIPLFGEALLQSVSIAAPLVGEDARAALWASYASIMGAPQEGADTP